MPRKTHKPEEIAAKLRQVDVLVSQGRSVAEAVRTIGVTQFTCYRWRKEFGGLETDQVKRLKELEKDRAIEAPPVRARWRGSGCGRPSPISRSRSSSCGRPPRETSRPRSPPSRRRARPREVPDLGAGRLSRSRPASVDPSRKVPRGRADQDALTADIIALATRYGRYGYRRITALLREAGWAVNAKRAERIWRRD